MGAVAGETVDPVPLALLDFVGIEYGESAHDAIEGAVRIAQAAEAAGYRRYWVSEHHNMANLACSSPELLTAHVGARTSHIRVGAAGIMLPNHAPLRVAEMFRTLTAMYPGRIDLGLGRAPGTDPLTAHVLRRGISLDPGTDFPRQVGELLAFLGDGFPPGHPYQPLLVAPPVEERPDVFMLGSSGYGPSFAAVNGLATVFAHHMSPEPAVDLLREYRREFRPRHEGDQPYSAMSVLTFASDDDAAVTEFRAGWTLTIDNLRRGVREPVAPQAVQEFAATEEFRRRDAVDARMVTGDAASVVERLSELKAAAEVDEIVLVMPGVDRERRCQSLRDIADAWRKFF